MKKLKTIDPLESLKKNVNSERSDNLRKYPVLISFYRFLYNHTEFRPPATTQANMPKWPNGLVAGGRAAWGQPGRNVFKLENEEAIFKIAPLLLLVFTIQVSGWHLPTMLFKGCLISIFSPWQFPQNNVPNHYPKLFHSTLKNWGQ